VFDMGSLWRRVLKAFSLTRAGIQDKELLKGSSSGEGICSTSMKPRSVLDSEWRRAPKRIRDGYVRLVVPPR